MDTIDHVYIMHYSKLTERKKKLNDRLISAGIDMNKVVWVEHFDRETATAELIEEFYKPNPALLSRTLTIPEIMNGIAHLYILDKARSHSITLILEDDIIFKENFLINVKKCLELAPQDWEILTLGGDYSDGTEEYKYGDTSPVKYEDLQVVTPKQPVTPVSCFLIKPTAAERIISSKLSKPFFGPIDYMFCYFIPTLNIKLYWSKPFLSYEASKMGECESSLLERGF